MSLLTNQKDVMESSLLISQKICVNQLLFQNDSLMTPNKSEKLTCANCSKLEDFIAFLKNYEATFTSKNLYYDNEK